MGSGHSHGIPGQGGRGAERRLWIVLALTTTFLTAEVIGGILTKSLALLSDAAHMFTDAAALAIALVAIRIGKRVADRKRTFGYQRFEIIAAAFNASVLFMVAFYILYEAVQRFRSPEPVASGVMLIIATFGLLVNFIGMLLLRGGSEDSLNVKGAYLEVWSDMLGSLGVIVAAVLISLTGFMWIDSVVAAAIGLWVLPRTWTLLKESINVLLQGVPKNVDLDALEQAIEVVSGVGSIHDLHVWSLTSGKDVLQVHVVIEPDANEQALLQRIQDVIRAQGIHHSTVQVEAGDCYKGAADQHQVHASAEDGHA